MFVTLAAMGALAIGFVVLAIVFAKNALRARHSDEIYNKSILIRRSKSPVNFCMTVIFYAFATVFALGAACFIVFILFTLGPTSLGY
jgi:hypothetical protein